MLLCTRDNVCIISKIWTNFPWHLHSSDPSWFLEVTMFFPLHINIGHYNPLTHITVLCNYLTPPWLAIVSSIATKNTLETSAMAAAASELISIYRFSLITYHLHWQHKDPQHLMCMTKMKDASNRVIWDKYNQTPDTTYLAFVVADPPYTAAKYTIYMMTPKKKRAAELGQDYGIKSQWNTVFQENWKDLLAGRRRIFRLWW